MKHASAARSFGMRVGPGNSRCCDGSDSEDDGRVPVYNTVTHRHLKGMAAPKRKHLKRYLEQHPECIVSLDNAADPSRQPVRRAGEPPRKRATAPPASTSTARRRITARRS